MDKIAGDDIIVPYQAALEGVVLSRLTEGGKSSSVGFYEQTISSALTLAGKFQCDRNHFEFVRKMSLFLFDALEDELGLSRRARMLLEVAAILHDIGSFIGEASHHLHGEYIVRNSEIFGLSRDELGLVAGIVRYHRGDHPRAGDQGYSSLPRDERTLILKLAAILRVADALDCRHSQHVPGYTIELAADTLFLHPAGAHDTTMEKFALERKGALFEEVFGYALAIAR